jgi:hypothetical protein
MMVTTQMQKAMRDFHEGKFKSMDEALAAHGGKDVEHLSSQEFTERTGQEAETATKYGSVVFDMNDLPHTNETKH